MSEAVLVVVAAIGWTIAATVISQIVSIGIMSWLGLPPKKLIHEIEVIQNPAVGASFFIISLAVGFFIGAFTSDGFSTNDASYPEATGWIVLALVLGFALTWLSFEIAHRVMGVENDETTYQYIRRELVQEQNASLAFFLGGLSIVPFIAVVFQMI